MKCIGFVAVNNLDFGTYMLVVLRVTYISTGQLRCGVFSMHVT